VRLASLILIDFLSMKVMKFGGTSVGRPERIKQVAALVTQQDEPVLVVLSALSGTTNALVEIGNLLSAGKKQQAAQVIDQLEKHYQAFIVELVSGKEAQEELSREQVESCLTPRIRFYGTGRTG